MSGIAIRNVWFSYGKAAAVLKGLTLDVRPGRIAGLLGKNGAGKTTALRIVAGLLAPDEGDVTVAGIAVAKDPVAVKRVITFVPDHSLLYDALSAEENMNMFGLLWGVGAGEIRSRSRDLLQQVGLWDARARIVGGYSAGMKQKLSFCAALLHDPSVIVIDEPFTAFDCESAMWAREVLRTRARAGAAILFSSHDADLVDALATEVHMFEDGRLAAPAVSRREA
jgi:ABC-2 type transport system ATP-binding protein